MTRLLVSLALMLAIPGTGFAQPSTNAAQANRVISSYVYLANADGDKVLVTTQFWRNDPKYDERTLHRFLDVLAALEKRGFAKNDKATIDSWDKPEPFARCYVYLEDVQSAGRTKGAPVSGTRVWCSENGASEYDVKNSESAKHVDEVLRQFDVYFERSKKNVRKG